MAKRNKGSRPNLKANVIREGGASGAKKKSIRSDIPAWDNFEYMYSGIQAGIIMHQEYLKHLEDPKIVEAIPDKRGTVDAIKALQRGLVDLQNNLNSAHTKHRGKTGDCRESDFVLFQTVFRDYDVLRGDYQDNVEPHGTFVMNQILEAQKVIASDSTVGAVGDTIKENIIADSEDNTTSELETVNNG